MSLPLLVFRVVRIVEVVRVVRIVQVFRIFWNFQLRLELGDYLFDRLDLNGPLDYLHQPPALVFAERAGLFDADEVADASTVLLVMRLEFGGEFVASLVNAVSFERLDGDDNSLLHLVAGHTANLLLAVPLLLR